MYRKVQFFLDVKTLKRIPGYPLFAVALGCLCCILLIIKNFSY